MKNFKKYVTLNLLSVFGLIFLAFTLMVIFYIYPEAKVYDQTSGEDFAYEQAGTVVFYIFTLQINMITVFVFLFAAFIEFLIYKYRKTEPKLIKIPDRFNKIHIILFKSGLIFSIFAFMLGVIYMFLPVA